MIYFVVTSWLHVNFTRGARRRCTRAQTTDGAVGGSGSFQLVPLKVWINREKVDAHRSGACGCGHRGAHGIARV